MKFDHEKLKKIRLQRCLTLEAVAEMVNQIKDDAAIGKSHVYTWESNTVPNANNLMALAIAFDVDVKDFYS